MWLVSKSDYLLLLQTNKTDYKMHNNQRSESINESEKKRKTYKYKVYNIFQYVKTNPYLM